MANWTECRLTVGLSYKGLQCKVILWRHWCFSIPVEPKVYNIIILMVICTESEITIISFAQKVKLLKYCKLLKEYFMFRKNIDYIMSHYYKKLAFRFNVVQQQSRITLVISLYVQMNIIILYRLLWVPLVLRNVLRKLIEL